DLHRSVDLADDGEALRDARLEQLLDAWQTHGDVLAGDAAGVERTHGQLRARLADGLRRDDADGLADLHQLAGGEIAAVALAADAELGVARLWRAHTQLRDLSLADALADLVRDLV